MKRVFVCYSHADSSWLDRLLVHLKPLLREGSVSTFCDRDISADQRWRDRIKDEIANASIGILLVSADFLASDFINDVELPALFERRAAAKATILTIFVSPSLYKKYPLLADYQAVNDPQATLSSLSKQEQELLLVRLAEEVDSATKDLVSLNKSNVAALPEVDYTSASHLRMFSDARINLTKLAEATGERAHEGYAFANCLLVGPTVIYAPQSTMMDCTYTIPENEVAALWLRSNSQHLPAGVLFFPRMTCHKCTIEDIGFFDDATNQEEVFRNNVKPAPTRHLVTDKQ